MEKQTVIYPAVFAKDGKYILVKIPDVPGAVTQGEDLVDAVKMAEDAIGILLEDKTDYPIATDLKDIHVKKDETVALIPVDLAAYRRKHSKTIRKSVTIPDYLDRIAKEQKVNVSGVLTEALKLRFDI